MRVDCVASRVMVTGFSSSPLQRKSRLRGGFFFFYSISSEYHWPRGFREHDYEKSPGAELHWLQLLGKSQTPKNQVCASPRKSVLKCPDGSLETTTICAGESMTAHLGAVPLFNHQLVTYTLLGMSYDD